VSIFYVLPPRPLIGDHLAAWFGAWLPGLDWDEDTRENLAEALRAAATCHPDVFVVFREELPEGVPTSEALVDSFGAGEGDEVIEVRSFDVGDIRSRRWYVPPGRRAA
jgi:hypothetical protein